MNNDLFFFFYNLAHRAHFFDALITFLAVYFIFVVIILAFLFLYRNFGRREIILLCASGGIAWILAKILKVLIHTPRPFDVFSQIQPLFSESGYAFPSGHTMVASAIAFTLFFLNKKAGLPAQTGYVFMLFAIFIGFSRVVAGVHFPVDIFGGFVLGALIAFTLNKIFLDNKSMEIK